MKKKRQAHVRLAVGLLSSFALWTVLVRFVDVRSIGPMGSSVGFAELNGFVHKLTGVHTSIYTLTDWLGLIPIAVALGFGVLGLVQWIKRKRFLAVDRSILALGVFYVVVMAVYVFFEHVVINYRPILINGTLEASYPSSTTVLAACVMPTAAMQFCARVKNAWIVRCVISVTVTFTAFMVIGRLFSGVHWVTDIIGGVLLSGGLVTAYAAVCRAK